MVRSNFWRAVMEGKRGFAFYDYNFYAAVSYLTESTAVATVISLIKCGSADISSLECYGLIWLELSLAFVGDTG